MRSSQSVRGDTNNDVQDRARQNLEGVVIYISHVVTSPVIISDLNCLQQAVERDPKLIWKEGQKKYAWVGRYYRDYHEEDAAYHHGINPKDYGKCEHAIKVKGCKFEIGVVKRKDGKGYSLVWDFIGDGQKINDAIGKGAEKLISDYQEIYLQTFAAEEHNTQWTNLGMEGDEQVLELNLD